MALGVDDIAHVNSGKNIFFNNFTVGDETSNATGVDSGDYIIVDNVYAKGYGDNYVVAKAVHEMQKELKELHPDIFFSNLVYAPDKVGIK